VLRIREILCFVVFHELAVIGLQGTARLFEKNRK
jgi:hypothetical protein